MNDNSRAKNSRIQSDQAKTNPTPHPPSKPAVSCGAHEGQIIQSTRIQSNCSKQGQMFLDNTISFSWYLNSKLFAILDKGNALNRSFKTKRPQKFPETHVPSPLVVQSENGFERQA